MAGLISAHVLPSFLKDKYDLIEWIWYQDVIRAGSFFLGGGNDP